MVRRPLIGITPTPSTSTFDHGTFYRYCLSDTYVKAVWEGGGNPVILPWVSDTPEVILDELDGLILSGGGDIDPDRFGQERHAKANGIDNARDEFELRLMRAAAERDLPTLAICRGIQVMTVAFGGTIQQHVPDLGTEVQHRQQADGISQHDPSHRVVLENTPNPISELLGETELMTNSFHHQAPAEVPDPLRIAGRAEDGVVEAIWHAGMSFGIGVQWHPEMLAASDPAHAAFFRALIEAAKAPATV
jgi:putative glutamine amidotransferase